ncbi:hypothetical protein [Synechococcus sp. CCY 9618]|uniref:hypothetical protein n=1 Tax=Synechococcus sp. CCY 9618 TaxID=2815602 RepID=UPI001C2444D4|nr:hypothetical protein [Synechococcus sp. CCY 9618]
MATPEAAHGQSAENCDDSMNDVCQQFIDTIQIEMQKQLQVQQGKSPGLVSDETKGKPEQLQIENCPKHHSKHDDLNKLVSP